MYLKQHQDATVIIILLLKPRIVGTLTPIDVVTTTTPVVTRTTPVILTTTAGKKNGKPQNGQPING